MRGGLQGADGNVEDGQEDVVRTEGPASVGPTIASTVVQRFGVMIPPEKEKTALAPGRVLPAIPVNCRDIPHLLEETTEYVGYEPVNVSTVGTQTESRFFETADGATEGDRYITERDLQLHEIYSEIEQLLSQQQQDVRNNDIIGSLREALAYLYPAKDIRPDSGFEDRYFRSEVYTPDGGRGTIAESEAAEDVKIPPLYYNEPASDSVDGVQHRENVQLVEGEIQEHTRSDPRKEHTRSEETKEQSRSEETKEHSISEETKEHTRSEEKEKIEDQGAGGSERIDPGDSSLYLDMENSINSPDRPGNPLEETRSGRMRSTEVERLNGAILPDTLRPRRGRNSR